MSHESVRCLQERTGTFECSMTRNVATCTGPRPIRNDQDHSKGNAYIRLSAPSFPSSSQPATFSHTRSLTHPNIQTIMSVNKVIKMLAACFAICIAIFSALAYFTPSIPFAAISFFVAAGQPDFAPQTATTPVTPLPTLARNIGDIITSTPVDSPANTIKVSPADCAIRLIANMSLLLVYRSLLPTCSLPTLSSSMLLGQY